MSVHEKALPEAFIDRMRQQLGTEAESFFQAHQRDTPTSILKNPIKPVQGLIQEADQVPWNEHGAYLQERPSFIRDPLYQAGLYYSQEASSMVIGQVIEQHPFDHAPVCLDLCAAPGGKSLVLLNALQGKGFLISNEIHRSRANILDENLLKWGHSNSAVTQSDAKVIAQLGARFDLILIDAPCSGEGMFRKDIVAIQEWTPGHVKACAIRQQGILEDIMPALKEGGILIYSTCAYSPEENEEMHGYLMRNGMLPLKVEMDPNWGFTAISAEKNAYQAFLHKVKGEGFFFSAYRKVEPCASATSLGRLQALQKDHADLSYVKLPQGFRSIEWKGEVYAVDEMQEGLLKALDELRALKRPGVPLGQWKGKDFIPAQGLALVPDWTTASHTALSLEEAWAYLRRETPEVLGPDRGWTLASYQGQALGWIKWVNGRMKNHYTKEWRIRSRW